MKPTRRIREYLSAHPEWSSCIDLLISPPTSADVAGLWPEAHGSEVDSDAPTAYGVSRRTLYYKLRQEGQSHRFASMIACQRGPGLMTDSVFFAGQPMLRDQFRDKRQLKKVLAMAQRHGYKPSPSDVYEPGLARFQGDPEAFVPRTGGRGYIKSLCAKRGWGCQGAVNVDASTPNHDPHATGTRLAEDLVQGHLREEIRKNPALRNKKKELREKIIEKHGVY